VAINYGIIATGWPRQLSGHAKSDLMLRLRVDLQKYKVVISTGIAEGIMNLKKILLTACISFMISLSGAIS
jgi:hypothetical protein